MLLEELIDHPNWKGFPFRTVTGEAPSERDALPERTVKGDFIFYHGTSLTVARKIIAEKLLTHDDLGAVGIGTSRSAVGVYATIKSVKTKDHGAILRVVIAQRWFDEHPQSVRREIGGSGHSAFLIRAKEVPLLDAKIIRKFPSVHSRKLR